jgi:uncharacterized DUF497 family protein
MKCLEDNVVRAWAAINFEFHSDCNIRIPLASQNKRIYNNFMEMRLLWDAAERAGNLAKHGLDFANADWVLDSLYRLDVQSRRGGELRVQSFSYVLDVLAVLTVVHTARDGAARIISFRPASDDEREVYYEWLESE